MRLLSSIFLLAILSGCNDSDDNRFTVKGKVSGGEVSTVYLEENVPDGSRPVIADSARVGSDGSFKLETIANEESLFSLRSGKSMFPFAILINDSEEITVNADVSQQGPNYTVKGSEASQKMLDFESSVNDKARMIFELTGELDSLNRWIPTDSAGIKRKDSLSAVKFGSYNALVETMKADTRSVLETSSSPVLTLYVLGTFQMVTKQLGFQGFDKTETAEIINNAAKKFPDHSGIALQQKNLKPSKAPDFSLPDTSGKQVSLSSFQGQYVLVDFWASWCGPCRDENPNVVAAYERFKDRNFTVLGVSLDREKSEWMKAIRTDNLKWTQISDLKFWNSEAASLYGVNSIPYNFLIDPQGNIVAENIRGPQLQATLQKLLPR